MTSDTAVSLVITGSVFIMHVLVSSLDHSQAMDSKYIQPDGIKQSLSMAKLCLVVTHPIFSLNSTTPLPASSFRFFFLFYFQFLTFFISHILSHFLTFSLFWSKLCKPPPTHIFMELTTPLLASSSPFLFPFYFQFLTF